MNCVCVWIRYMGEAAQHTKCLHWCNFKQIKWWWQWLAMTIITIIASIQFDSCARNVRWRKNEDRWVEQQECEQYRQQMKKRKKNIHTKQTKRGWQQAIICNFHIKPNSDWAFDLVWRAKINDVIECDKRLIILKQLSGKSTAPCRRLHHFNRNTNRICWFMFKNSGETGNLPTQNSFCSSFSFDNYASAYAWFTKSC